MKKICLLICISFNLLQAQEKVSTVDIRGHFGIGYISLSSDNATVQIGSTIYKNEISTSPLFQGGLGLTFGDRFFVQPGITWQAVGIQTKKTEVNGSNNVNQQSFVDEAQLKMITVPLKVGFRLRESDKKINVRVFGGIDGQFITSVSQTKQSGLVTIKKNDFNKMLTYADLGLGFDFFFLFADAGYRFGLNPVMNVGDKSKASIFYTNLGIKIKF